MRHFRITIRVDRRKCKDSELINFITAGSLLAPLPPNSTSQNTVAKSYPSFSLKNKKDYRRGPIRIDWIDFRYCGAMLSTSAGKEREIKRSTTPIAEFQQFSSGTTDFPEGIVHIFREAPIARTDELSPHSPSTSKAILPSAGNSLVSDDQTLVAVLAVPSWMTPSDFLAFVAPAAESMAHLRLIRDSQPNRTMVIIQFRESTNATEFIEEFNGRQYNTVEPETCSIVRVRSVNIEFEDPLSTVITRSSINPNVMYELPTCPVCLDRMDASVTGLVTVPCSHTFHCSCLSKWGDSRCPVCRYSQNTLSPSPQSSSTARLAYSDIYPSISMSSCSECDSRISLWVCLICGNVGCGRLGRAHAKGHYELTMHAYAMELETQRVWDYLGDNYVHRLIQNKADGKLVELPSASNLDAEDNLRGRSGQGPGADDDLKAEKVEIMAMQYSQILQRALDDQRQTYDEQLKEMKKHLEESHRKLEHMSQCVEVEVKEAREERLRHQQEAEEARLNFEREKAKSEKKASKLGELAKKLEHDLQEERAVSEGLLKNLAQAKESIDQANHQRQEFAQKVSELQDQLHDVMFFLEARTKIEQGEGVEAEAQGGSVVLSPDPPDMPNTKGKKKKKK